MVLVIERVSIVKDSLVVIRANMKKFTPGCIGFYKHARSQKGTRILFSRRNFLVLKNQILEMMHKLVFLFTCPLKT